MKTFLLAIAFLLGVMSPTFAQPGGGGNKSEKVEALYVAYMTKQLNLTEDEAQKFWPIHTQYDNELKAVERNNNELERQQNALNVKKKYQDRFIKVLGADRTNEFFRTDAEFRKRMIERLKAIKEKRNDGRVNQ